MQLLEESFLSHTSSLLKCLVLYTDLPFNQMQTESSLHTSNGLHSCPVPLHCTTYCIKSLRN